MGATGKSASGPPGGTEETGDCLLPSHLPAVSAFQELRAPSLLLSRDSLPGTVLHRAVSIAADVHGQVPWRAVVPAPGAVLSSHLDVLVLGALRLLCLTRSPHSRAMLGGCLFYK